KKPKFTFTDPTVKVPLRIVDRQPASHDTIRLKLALPSTEHRPGIPVGTKYWVRSSSLLEMDGKDCAKIVLTSYPPVHSYMRRIELIKVYKANTNPSFPRGGKMSQYLMNIPRDQYIDVRGPSGNLHYKGLGVFDIKPDESSPAQKYTAKFVNMICGGSGITPMFQLLSYILSNDKDMTRLSLVFANNSEGDILLRDELDAYTTKFPNQLRVWYVVKEPPA
ncbi:oxidoreductase, FAD-binding protein, partial [Opisthorchis viverrini]